jgi:hypothetical protein
MRGNASEAQGDVDLPYTCNKIVPIRMSHQLVMMPKTMSNLNKQLYMQ